MKPIGQEQVDVLKALADPTRLGVLLLLKDCPPDAGYCVTSLANRLDVSQPAISQHLRILRQLGLVQGERRGYRVHYSVNRQRLQELREMMSALLSPDEG